MCPRIPPATLVGHFALEPRGSIDVKGKGKLETFFLSRI